MIIKCTDGECPIIDSIIATSKILALCLDEEYISIPFDTSSVDLLVDFTGKQSMKCPDADLIKIINIANFLDMESTLNAAIQKLASSLDASEVVEGIRELSKDCCEKIAVYYQRDTVASLSSEYGLLEGSMISKFKSGGFHICHPCKKACFNRVIKDMETVKERKSKLPVLPDFEVQYEDWRNGPSDTESEDIDHVPDFEEYLKACASGKYSTSYDGALQSAWEFQTTTMYAYAADDGEECTDLDHPIFGAIVTMAIGALFNEHWKKMTSKSENCIHCTLTNCIGEEAMGKALTSEVDDMIAYFASEEADEDHDTRGYHRYEWFQAQQYPQSLLNYVGFCTHCGGGYGHYGEKALQCPFSYGDVYYCMESNRKANRRKLIQMAPASVPFVKKMDPWRCTMCNHDAHKSICGRCHKCCRNVKCSTHFRTRMDCVHRERSIFLHV